MGSNRGTAALRRLQAVGDRELPDSRLSAEARAHLKGVALDLATRYAPEMLMFLAGALEREAGVEAQR